MTSADTQWANERVAALAGREDIAAAKALAAMRFRIAHGKDVPEEAWPSFDGAIDEWVGNYLFKAVASDPYHPRFVRDFLPPQTMDGMQVTGARMGGDNPDNYYRLAGIEHGGRYLVKGKVRGQRPANSSFTLVGNWGTSVTIDGVETESLELDAKGQFTLTISDRPADAGEGPHLVTKPGTKFLFLRDTMCDWSQELPWELSIERLDDPGRGPLTEDEMAAAAAFRLVEDVPLYFWFHRIFSGKAENHMDAPYMSGGIGGLVTQAGCHGRLKLGEDECAIIDFGTANAAYSAFQLTDWWFRSVDAHRNMSTLTHAQAVPQADGSFQLVAARRDPGVVNWLDMNGLENCLLLGRWQGLKPGAEPPLAAMRIARIDDLGGGRIDKSARERQIAQRRAEWDRRLEQAM